jgi:hypothetical protein
MALEHTYMINMTIGPKRSFATNILFAVFLAALLIGHISGLSCDVWDHDEDIESLDGIGKVNGLSFKYHPRNPLTGDFDFDTYLAWKLGNFEETDSFAPMWHKCDIENKYPSEINATVYRRMVIAELNCEFVRGHRLLAPGVNQTFLQVNATWPTHPNFYLLFEVVTVNAEYSEHFGDGPLTDGYNYTINYKYVLKNDVTHLCF